MTQHENSLKKNIAMIFVSAFVSALAVYFVPKFFNEGKQISYTVETPVSYLNDEEVQGTVQIRVSGETTRELYAHRVRIWNSGDQPVSGIPVRIVFEDADSSFSIFSIRHDTQPPREFGEIKTERPANNSVRFVYPLLNTGDEDLITILSNSSSEAVFYARSKGLGINQVASSSDQEGGNLLIPAVVAGIFTLIVGLLGMYFGNGSLDPEETFESYIWRTDQETKHLEDEMEILSSYIARRKEIISEAKESFKSLNSDD